jgi:hypothetical protein
MTDWRVLAIGRGRGIVDAGARGPSQAGREAAASIVRALATG